MPQYLNANELKSQVSIVTLLSKLGFEPVPRHGREKIYLSMLRTDDTQPSLSVNDQLGLWYDHGTGQGGNLIDFGLAYWKPSTFSEVVQKINEVWQGLSPAERSVVTGSQPSQSLKAPQIDRLKRIGTHPAITGYLRSRSIFKVAAPYLQEVYYTLSRNSGQTRHYFAAGWKNERGGWEVRNQHFKGCLGHKAITFLAGHPKNVVVFEGFFDFLSWKQEHPAADTSVIVLNSLSLLKTAIAKAQHFSCIDIFFDRDKAGMAATRELLNSLPYATDRSAVYEHYNDYNDKLVAQQKAAMERSVNSSGAVFKKAFGR